METVDLVRQVEFDALFTFIFSPRPGTPAAKWTTPCLVRRSRSGLTPSAMPKMKFPPATTPAMWARPCAVWWTAKRTMPAGRFSARTAGGRLVHLVGDKAALGEYRDVKITDSNTWALFGEMV